MGRGRSACGGCAVARHRLLASLRNDAELDLPLLDIEYRIGRVALGKDGLAFAVLADAPALPDEGEKRVWIEWGVAV